MLSMGMLDNKSAEICKLASMGGKNHSTVATANGCTTNLPTTIQLTCLASPDKLKPTNEPPITNKAKAEHATANR